MRRTSRPTPTVAAAAKAPGPAPASGPGQPIEALAAASGVTVRNIRAWQSTGLLPPPRLQGRLGLYSDEHARRIELIRALRDQGFGLEAIRGIFERAPAEGWRELAAVARSVSGSLFAQEAPQTRPAESLAAKWKGQMTPELLARATRAGLMRELPGGQVQILSPALAGIAEQLAALGLPLPHAIEMQEALVRNLRTVARQWLRTLADSLLSADPIDVEHGQRLLEQARALALGAVQAAFPVILQQALDQMLRPKS